MFKGIALLAGLSPQTLQAMEGLAHKRTYRRRQTVLLEGDPGEHFFIILRGKIKLAKTTPEGQEKVLQILKEGDVFGELILFDKGLYPYDVETLEDSELLLLPVGPMRSLMEENKDLAWLLAGLMAKRLRQGYRNIKNLALKDTYGRVASKLFKLGRDFGIQEGNKIRIGLHLTRNEFASLVGTSRETVSRILNDFERQGLLMNDNHQIIITDLEALKERALFG